MLNKPMLEGASENTLKRPDLTPEIWEERAEEAAIKFGFDLPENGSIALSRLISVCNDYAQKVDYQNKSPLAQTDDRVRTKSDEARRRVHNDLCVKLLGTAHQNTSSDDRKRISNFAVTVAGMEQYVDTF